MGTKPDSARKHYGSQLGRNLRQAVAQRIGQEFPRLGGPRIQELCADLVLEVVEAHLQPREHLRHGQVLWMAVALDDPPHRARPLARTRMVPVVLDLSTPEDIKARLDKRPAADRVLGKALRLCEQAHAQGGLLADTDLAELLATHDARVAQLLAAHERSTGTAVPRRATLHDVGTALTHKGVICRKRYREGKDFHEIARETHHSLEAVDRYIKQFDRVRAARRQGLTPHETAYYLGCSVALVNQYLELDRELEVPEDEPVAESTATVLHSPASGETEAVLAGEHPAEG